MVVEHLRHSPPLPPVSSTPVGAARSRPGRQVGDPYQAQKLLACSNQRDTTYSPFTLTYYLRPRRWAMPGGLGNQYIGTGSVASLFNRRLSPVKGGRILSAPTTAAAGPPIGRLTVAPYSWRCKSMRRTIQRRTLPQRWGQGCFIIQIIQKAGSLFMVFLLGWVAVIDRYYSVVNWFY